MIDPGEVAICFGDEGTWCPLYQHDSDGKIEQTYSDGEETVSSSITDDDLLNLSQNVKSLNINNKPSSSDLSTTDNRSSLTSCSNNMSNYTISTDINLQIDNLNDFNSSMSNSYSLQTIFNDWNSQQNNLWSQNQLSTLDGLLYQGGHF